MRRRLGPRVGVSSTRYAFRLPRSATMMREVGVISELLTNAARAGKAAYHVSYNWIRCSRQGCAAKEISTPTRLNLAQRPRRSQRTQRKPEFFRLCALCVVVQVHRFRIFSPQRVLLRR